TNLLLLVVSDTYGKGGLKARQGTTATVGLTALPVPVVSRSGASRSCQSPGEMAICHRLVLAAEVPEKKTCSTAHCPSVRPKLGPYDVEIEWRGETASAPVLTSPPACPW